MNVTDVVCVRVAGVVVERTVSKRHRSKFPPLKVVIKEVRLIQEFLLVCSTKHDHRADLDHLTGQKIPAGEDATPMAL